MALRKIIITALSVLFISHLYAGSAVNKGQFINHKDWSFIENKGQLADENGNLLPDIKFYGRQGGVNLYCKPGAIRFVFTKSENTGVQVSEATGETSKFVSPGKCPGANPSKITINSAELVLLNSNPDARIIASDQQTSYKNFFLANTPEAGVTNVATYKTITYKNIYPNIDLVLHTKKLGMKYEFVVYPGGDVNDIQVQWNGIENLQMTEDGGISYKLALGNMEESKPLSYQGKNVISSSFAKNTSSNIGFNVAGYDKSQTLVIDPSLTWGTYFGGSAADYSYGVATDASGNVYITGYTLSTSGIATSGASLTSNAGTDAFLAKFNSAGVEQWSTYYGGGNENSFGVSIDNSGNAFITGSTSGTTGIATTGAYQSTNGGGSNDVFLAKFNGSGVRQWGTYFGGSGAEIGYGVATDGSGNVYITGVTASSSGIASSGAYQSSYGGSNDAFLAEFNSSGSRQWSTYLGGTGADVANGISVNGSTNIYIVGSTTSATKIATTGGYQTAEAGSNDAFLVKFNGSGTPQWGTYYGGNSTDIGQAVATDASGNVYITGYTGSGAGIATSGTYQTAGSGGGTDGFLAGFSSSGARLWGTYYGGINADYCYGIATDATNNIYVTGTTMSTKGGIATSGAYQSSNGGNGDAFLAKFKNNGSIQVGSYYGGRLSDNGQGIAVYNTGAVYITGYTASDTGIATSGSFMSSNAGGTSDAFLSSFNFLPSNDAGVVSVLSPAGTFCPAAKTVTVQIENYGLAVLKQANINWSINKVLQAAYSWTGSLKTDSTATVNIGSFYFLTGNDTIRAWTSKPNGVTDSTAANDSALRVDTGYVSPLASVTASTAICSGSSISLGTTAISGHAYSWTSVPTGFTSTLANPSFSPTANTVFSLTETITATGCSTTHSDTISLPVATAGTNATICAGIPVLLGETAYKGNIYSWTSSPSGFTSTSSNPTVNPTVTTTYFFKDSVMNGCSKTASAIITVNPLPAATVTANTAICSGNSISLGSATTTGHTYSWTSVPSGFTSTLSNPSANPTLNTIYTLTETITATGCSRTNSDTISLPAAVPVSSVTVCSGTSISLGGPAYPGHHYSWTSSPAGFTSTLSNPSIIALFAKTYTLKDSVAGCVKISSDAVTVNQVPNASILTSSGICPGTSISLGGPNNSTHSYAWSSSPAGFNSTISNPSVKPSVTTIYFLTETITATGCSKTNSDTFSFPVATTINDTSICPGTSISIGGTAYTGHTYTWTSTNGFGSKLADPTIKPTITATYYLVDAVPTSTGGCNVSDSVVITVLAAPAAKVVPGTSLCPTGSISIGAAAVSGDTYSWTSSPSGFTSTLSNPTVSPSVATIYTLTEKITSTGCSTAHSDTISFPTSTSVIPSTAICAGNSISIGGIAYSGNTYSWTSSPAGFTSTLANPNVTPTTTTTYNFKDTAIAGCKNAGSVTITVNPLPLAKTISNTTICAGTPTPIGASSVAGDQYIWTSNPTGFTSTLSNPYVHPTSTRIYYLTETVTATGCTKSDSVIIYVNPLPAASVIANTIICPGTSVSLGGTAVSGDYYSWSSSNSGFTSTLANPSVKPSTTTYYTLTEEVISTGCSMTNTDTIWVGAASVISNTAICAGSSISIGGASSKGSNYTWTSTPPGFSSTISNPTVTPASTITYNLKDSITGCVNNSSVTITVNPLPAAKTISNSTVCAGISISLGATAVTGSKYNWTSSPTGFTSTLSNPSVTPTATTTYYLTETLTATGCSKTNSVIINVNPLPAASVIANTAICSGGSLSIGAAAVAGDTYSWTSNPSGFTSASSNPSATPTVTTIYTLTETVTATGCSNTHSDTISLPTATVIANTAICSGASIALGGPSFKGDYYSWTSSPVGFTSTVSNPTVTPTTTTTYSLKDSVTGCSKTSTVTITINPLPAASVIAATSVCSGSTISIGAASVTGDTYAWSSTPSGFTSTLANPSPTQTATTTYTLTEIITATGCKNTNSVKITNNPLPSASVIANTVTCPGSSISIGAASVTGDSYSWTSVPTGFTSSLANPAASPTVKTAFILTEIINATGCTKTNSDTISLPTASVIASTAICAGNSISIGGPAYKNNNYSWTSSPKGFTSTVINPTVTPTTTTSYYLKDTISGCKIIDTVTITVNPLPAAKVIASTAVCSGSSISLGATAVVGDNYSWTSSPTGFTSSLANPTATPTAKTIYILTETNTTTGCVNTNSDTISVPVANVAASATICAGTSVALGGTSSTGDIYSWTSSPAGFTSSLANPTITPSATTTYTLKDTVSGCKKTGTVTITVNPVPAAKVAASTAICSGTSVSLGGTAVAGNSYSWTSSPTGFTSTTSNPAFTVTATTIFTLTEMVLSTGCSTTHSDTISLPTTLSVTSATVCSGSPIAIGVASYPGNIYSWTSSPGSFSSTLSNPTVSPITLTTYTLRDSVKGCSKNSSIKITVSSLPAATIINGNTVCSGSPISLGGTAVAGSKYLWSSSPSGFSSTSSNPVANPIVKTKYYQTETNAAGCSKKDSVTISVNPLPSATIKASTVVCNGTTISLGATSITGHTYSWTGSSGFTSTSANPTVTPSTTTTYTLIETITATGCSKTSIDTMTLPRVSYIANTGICPGSSIAIGGTAYSGNIYTWTSSPAGFTSTSANPTVSPSTTTKYYVKDSLSGCKQIDSVTVKINSVPAASVIAATTVCAGSSIGIGANAVTGDNYSWTSSVSGFSSTSSNPIVNPTSTATYTLTETNSSGCSKTNSVTITVSPVPAAAVIANTAICSGGSVSVGASSVTGDTYSWTSAPSGFTSTVSNPSVTPTVTTDYILTENITATGCSKTDTVIISLPSASIASNATLCGGTGVAIGETSFGGNIYSWTSKPTGFTSTIANPTVSPATTTTYYFKDSVIKGCSIIDSVKITVNAAPAAKTIASTSDCAATSIAIGAASVTGDKYSWSSVPFGFTNATSNPVVSPTKTTSYILTETIAATGCSKTDTVVISVPSASVAANTAICPGTSVSIGSGTGNKGDKYSWTSSPSGFTSTVPNPTASPTVTTTYTLKDSASGLGCKTTNSVTVTVNPVPAAKVISSTTDCSGNPIAIGATAVTGDTYSWTSSPTGFTSTSSNPSVSPSVNTVYFLTETITATGCTKSNSDTILLPSAPVGSNATICSGTSISIGQNFTPFKGNLYSWTSSPAGFTSTVLNPIVSPVVTTTYSFKDSVISSCSKTSTVTVTVNPLPAASVLASTSLCSGSLSIGAAAVGGDTYSWTSSPAGFTSTLANPTVTPSGTTIYYLTETNPVTGCSKTNSDTISFGASASVIANTSVCLGTPTLIGGISYAGNNYSWTSSPAGFTSTLANPSVSPTVKTTYYLKDSVSSGCKIIDSVTLSITPAPAAKTASNSTACSGTPVAIGAASVAGSTYSWASSPSGFSSTSSNPTASPKVTTSYYLTETAASTGCSKTDTVVVTAIPLPAAAVIANSPICYGSYILIGGSPVSGNKYSWSSSPAGFNSILSNPIVSPTVKTTYTLTDTNTVTGCYNSNSVTISVNPLPNATTINSTAICTGNGISIGGTGVTGDKYNWTSNPSGYTSTTANPIVNPTKTTTYYLTETITATGCSKSDSVSITVNPLPAAPVIANTTDCAGFPIFLGGKKDTLDTYSWSSSPTGFSSDSANPSDTPEVKTTYMLTEKIIATGCTKTNSVVISINPVPVPIAIPALTVCAGTQITMGAKAVSGDQYSWSSKPAGFSATTSSVTTNLSDTSTTYFLKETIPATGCYRIDSGKVTAKPRPQTNAGPDATICAGTFAAIGVNPVKGYKYSWTSVPVGFTSTFSDPAVYPTTSTTFILTDTLSSDKCIKIDTVNITVIPLPAASIIKNTGICIGSSIALGAAPVNTSTYSWTSNPPGFTSTLSNPTVSPSATTTYYQTETSTVTGCSKTDSVKIQVNPLPNAAVIPNSPVCFNSFISLGAAAVSGDTYSWTSSPLGFSSTSSNPAASPTVKTTYYLTEKVTATGCTKKDSVKISVNPQPAAYVAAYTAICPGTSVFLGTTPVTGDTYSWASSPTGFSSTSSNPKVTPTTTTIYKLTETILATGCSKTDSSEVVVVPFPSAKVTFNQSICPGAVVALGTTGATGHTYSWTSSPSGFSSSLSDPTVIPKATTTYTLTEINTEAGCKTTNSVTITLKPAPAASVINDTALCTGSSIAIGAPADTGSTYAWTSSPAGFKSSASDPTVSPTTPTTYRLTETYNSSGCFTSNSVVITINPVPAAKVAGSTAICPGTSSAVAIGSTAVSGDTYSWSSTPNGYTSTSSDPTVNPTVTTTYKLTETITKTGCQNSNTISITVYPAPAVNAGKNETTCSGDSIILGAAPVGGITYKWTSKPAGFSSAAADPVIFPTASETYYLTETNSLGCSKTDSVVIIVNPTPDAHWSVITDSKGNASFTADSLKNKTYLWDLGNNYSAVTATPITSYIKSGKYLVSLSTKNAYGCTSTFDSVITIHIHTSGINEDSIQTFDLSLFPNPFRDATTLQYSLSQSTRVTVGLFDITGKEIGILEDNVKMEGQYSINIDAVKYHLTPGIYMLKFITDQGFVSRQIIKL